MKTDRVNKSGNKQRPSDVKNSVQVMFKNPKHNYITSVSPQSTERSCKDYFVGNLFNMGQYPTNDYQRCVSINFLGNNGVTA